MRTNMEQLREMAGVNTIVGDAILTSCETMVLPVSKVSLGFVTGGGEYGGLKKPPVKAAGEALDAKEGNYPFAGVAAAGMSITPTAFLSLNEGKVRVLPAANHDALERLIEFVPELMEAVERLASQKSGGETQCAESCKKGN